MLILENGKPYPDTRYRNNEGLLIVPTENHFFLLALVPNLTPAEIQAWKDGQMRYGIFIYSGVPFFLLEFPSVEMTFDAPFNAQKIPPEIRQLWTLRVGETNLLHLVLVEQTNYIVRAQRAIGMQPDITISLKAASMAAIMSRESAKQIDERIREVTATFTTADMISAGKMYTL